MALNSIWQFGSNEFSDVPLGIVNILDKFGDVFSIKKLSRNETVDQEMKELI